MDVTLTRSRAAGAGRKHEPAHASAHRPACRTHCQLSPVPSHIAQVGTRPRKDNPVAQAPASPAADVGEALRQGVRVHEVRHLLDDGVHGAGGQHAPHLGKAAAAALAAGRRGSGMHGRTDHGVRNHLRVRTGKCAGYGWEQVLRHVGACAGCAAATCKWWRYVTDPGAPPRGSGYPLLPSA